MNKSLFHHNSFCFVFIYLFTASLFLFMPLHAIGTEQTKSCHCFRNRTFNPADKFISDDYILATTFNSLLATEFNFDKRQIIMMKMREGVPNEDLLTALYISKETGRNERQLLQMKKKMTWQEIIKPMLSGTPGANSYEEKLSFILTSSSDAEIADMITRRLISSRFEPSKETLDLFQGKKLTARQIILCFTLANHAGIPAPKIADQFLANGLSWSEIAFNLGLQPADAGKLLAK